jgi:hypothetical protein
MEYKTHFRVFETTLYNWPGILAMKYDWNRFRFNDNFFVEKFSSLNGPILKTRYFFIVLNEKLTVPVIVEPTSTETKEVEEERG